MGDRCKARSSALHSQTLFPQRILCHEEAIAPAQLVARI